LLKVFGWGPAAMENIGLGSTEIFSEAAINSEKNETRVLAIHFFIFTSLI
jgi:hypothetical protein